MRTARQARAAYLKVLGCEGISAAWASLPRSDRDSWMAIVLAVRAEPDDTKAANAAWRTYGGPDAVAWRHLTPRFHQAWREVVGIVRAS